MSTQHDYQINVYVGEPPRSLGKFDTRSGGESDSDVSTRWTADGLEVFPARPTTGEVTVTRVYKRDRDHEEARELRKAAGKLKMSVVEQPLDVDGNPWGKPVTWTGLLKNVNAGDSDLASEEPRELELVMTVLSVA